MKKAHVLERNSHTALSNSVLQIPSEASFLIRADSFRNFENELRKLFATGLPPNVKYIFSALIVHGIKNDLGSTHQESLKQVSSHSSFQILFLFCLIF